jgi:hypothetical protein
MEPIICYRDDVDWQQEAESAQKHFTCTNNRMTIKPGQLVIPRFSFLPFANEFENEMKFVGAKLINSYNQHRYIADLGNWYHDLHEFTPMTWRNLHELPEDKSFILKGETNSRKFFWKTKMFAENKKEAIRVHSELVADSLIQYQQIYIREYVPLEKLYDGLQGLPITREYRFFVYKNKILCGGFYWSNYYEDLIEMGFKLDSSEVPESFLNDIINKVQNTKVCEPPNFYVIDVAKTAKNGWILIELNDSCMSGLSMNDPDKMYTNLKKALQLDGIQVVH